jgi:hypothetical protein
VHPFSILRSLPRQIDESQGVGALEVSLIHPFEEQLDSELVGDFALQGHAYLIAKKMSLLAPKYIGWHLPKRASPPELAQRSFLRCASIWV